MRPPMGEEGSLEPEWRANLLEALGGKGRAQAKLKRHLQGKDIVPSIDQAYLGKLWFRIDGILAGVCGLLVLQEVITEGDRAGFSARMKAVWDDMCQNDGAKVRKLNNQGRRPEQVLYTWMSGRLVEGVVVSLLSKALPRHYTIRSAGGDQVGDGHDFIRVADADYAVQLDGKDVLRIEVQSAFQSADLDLKLSKISEAQRRLRDSKTPTAVVMFDVNSGWLYWVSLKGTTVASDGETVITGTGQVKSRIGGKFEGVRVVSLSELGPSCGHLGRAKETILALVESLLHIAG